MRQFIIKIILFSILFILAVFLLNLALKKKLNNDAYYRLNPGVKYAVAGHSHPVSAFNDSLISNFDNLSSAMEGYFYTYYKMKKIIEANPQLEILFIEFTNNQVNSWADNRIWGEYMPNQLPKYWHLIEWKDMALLALKNPTQFIKAINVSIGKNFYFLTKKESNYMKYQSWGGHVEGSDKFFSTEKIDSLLLEKEIKDGKKIVRGDYSFSNKNLDYLAKTIHYCRRNNVKPYLIRSPLPYYSKQTNESTLQDILKNEFPDVPFLDFKDLPFSNEYFGDFQHLNSRGSEKFSMFFNHLLEQGLLDSVDAKSLIENEKEKIF